MANYLLMPLVFYYLIKFCLINNSYYKFGYIEKKKLDFKSFIINIFQLWVISLLFILAIALLPIVFMQITIFDFYNAHGLLEQLNIASITKNNEQFVLLISQYIENLWRIAPWPLLLLHVIFYHIIVRQHGIDNLKDLSNKLYPNKVKRNTLNNLFYYSYTVPYVIFYSLIIACVTYLFYIIILNYFAVDYLRGVNLYIIFYCAITCLCLCWKKRVIRCFKLFQYKNWSILQFFYFLSGVLILWLSLPVILSVIINTIFVHNINITSGIYNYFPSYSFNELYVLVVSTLWWLTIGMLARIYYRKLCNFNLSHNNLIISIILILFSNYLLINNSLVKPQLIALVSYILSLAALNKIFIALLCIFIIYSYLFKDKYTLQDLVFDKLEVNKSSKIKIKNSAKLVPAVNAYYGFLLVTIAMMILITLENIFRIHVFVAYLTILSNSYFIYCLRNYHKYIK